ncbi:MAG: glycosyltransferase family 4 protein [Acidimicrobiales bacterium]|nr:glycosyltransferase family 4 protein [Acidimicrobiales bacterium]
MRIGMLAPIAWRTPPRDYGPWEQVVATLTDALVERGVDVTLFATGDSATGADLVSVVAHGYETDDSYDVKVYEALHIATCFEHAAAGELDLIHNHFDFLPLAWSRLVPTPVVTTIHGFSSPAILPAYRRYDGHVHYVAISDSDRHPDLHYDATIHHGIDLAQFPYRPEADPDGHLLFFGRIHPDKGTHTAIDLARAAGRPLRIAGIIHDHDYFHHEVEPRLGTDTTYLGPVGGADRAAVLGAATALLHPVAFDEPFGLSVVEAFACGTPVVAYQRGAMAELIRPGHNGFLAHDIPTAVDALARIGTVDRAACRADAEQRFSAQRMAGDYLRLYQAILGGATGTPR